ncbi:aluminum-activated malate transporter 2-like [Malania oleifera]|uniref:aluminum-activated malate transporter 2-like n=1 Tax=Malania oleifera TaxID=397392 RepID=UPI0025AE3440|nr:aluminum-activated malate transporter 2-like [Malania oleifera]
MAEMGEKAGGAGWWRLMKSQPERAAAKVMDAGKKMKKLGEDDPRRVFHSLKVGLALTLISLFYYFQPIYDSFGTSATWAVMTVVVVFEFSVGATLGKGINRGLATLVAGALGVGAHHLACLCGHTAEPILLGFFVFLQAAASTFLRFFPAIKARYDYGILIFILTFSLVSVSGFRDDEILELAQKRMSTILIGSCVCVIISIFVRPVWAGEDLHNLIASNLEKLGTFLDGFGEEYFNTVDSVGESNKEDKSFLQGYKSVLNSKASEESLANFARWEPGHGRFKFRHPWQQYLKIGTLARQCAYRIEALSGYLNSEIETPQEIRQKIQDACIEMSSETGKALMESALVLRHMTQTSSANPHVANSKTAAKNLKSLLKSGLWEEIAESDLLAVIPAATVASLLIDVVFCTETIADSVRDLASLARFKCIDPTVSPEKSQQRDCDAAKSLSKADCAHVVIEMGTGPSPENAISAAPAPATGRQAEV